MVELCIHSSSSSSSTTTTTTTTNMRMRGTALDPTTSTITT
jgi:hypothetical protein